MQKQLRKNSELMKTIPSFLLLLLLMGAVPVQADDEAVIVQDFEVMKGAELEISPN